MAEFITGIGIKLDPKGVQKGSKDVNRALGSIEKKAITGQRGMSKGFAKLKEDIFGLKGAFISLGGTLIGGFIVKTTTEFQKLQASLITVTGSAQNATIAFDAIKQFASQTPFSVSELTESFILLKALGLEPTERTLRSFGNTASAMGKTFRQFSEAVADAMTGQFERLKEFGIGASLQGDKVAFTFQKITTVVGKNATEIEAYLTTIGENQFAGAMERQMQTLGGAFSNLGDSVQLFAASLGEGGLSTAVTGFAGLISSTLKEIMLLTTETKKADDASMSLANNMDRIVVPAIFALDTVFGRVLRTVGGVAAMFDNILAGNMDLAGKIGFEVIAAQIQDVGEAWDDFLARRDARLADLAKRPGLKSLVGDGKDGEDGKGGTVLTQKMTQLKALTSQTHAYGAAILKMFDNSRASTLELKIQQGAYDKLSKSQLDVARAAALAADRAQLMRDETDMLAASMAKAEEEQKAYDNTLKREAQSIIKSTATAQDTYNDSLLRLSEMLSAGLLNQSEYMRALEQTKEVLNSTSDQSKEMADFTRDLGLTFTSAFEEAITSGKSLRDVMAGLLQDIAKLIARRLVIEPLLKSLSDSLGGGSSGGGGGGIFGFLGSLLGGGSQVGNGIGNLDDVIAGPFAAGGAFKVPGSGGTDSSKVSFLATPGERVTVERPGQNLQGGGSVTKIVYNIDARGADAGVEARIRAAMQETESRTLARIRDAKRRRRTA